ncbi:MAG: tyrosine--tRNA ligase [Candidatus Zapsychrus exili]|nr:tyrosine--tRNA ligase [Candidatus Zapsychrus exili]
MEIKNLITDILRGTSEAINVETLEKKLIASSKSGKSLNIKAGFDPTAPDIHLGHVVLLRKLRQLQDLGHKVFFLIGDFTAQIGDPTGRDQTRKKIDQRQIKQNSKTYQKQAFKILDLRKTKIVFNSSWLSKLSIQKMLELTAYSTVAQMLARADFKKRAQKANEITILEFIYPLLQGYDSVHLKADIELGGTDQRFNLLMGRQIQEAYGQEPQAVIMTPLLEGTDGVQKMSKSLNNYIGINESSKDIFGKIMSINDDLMYKYFEFLTDESLDVVRSLHPKEAKLLLAQRIVAQFYDENKAKEEKQDFDKVFSQHQLPEDMPEYDIKDQEQLVDILLKNKFVESKNEVRRLIKQGAITHDGKKIGSEDFMVKKGVLKVGKRRFLKIK